MACSTTLSGIARDCSSSMGGIRKVALFDYSAKGNVFGTLDNEGAILAANSYTYFKPYSFKKNTGSMTSTLTVDGTNGTNYWTTEVALTFNRQELAKRLEIQALATGEVGALVQDSNGTWYTLGADEPVVVTASTANSGTAKSDGNNYQITLTDESVELPYIVNDKNETNITELSYINALFN